MQLSWLGPLSGAIIGYFLAGGGGVGLIGVIAGVLVGRQFDKVIQLSNGLYQPTYNQTESRASNKKKRREDHLQDAFFDATFLCLGRVAKCDGVVCQAEINWVKQIMERMDLLPSKVQEAIALFNKGKSAEYDITQNLRRLQNACGQHSILPELFMEMLVQEALVDASLDKQEWAVLSHIASTIQFASSDLERLIRNVLSYQEFRNEKGKTNQEFSSDLLVKAYSILGVSPKVSFTEAKRAYRKQMSQHHPDKMNVHGIPEEMLRVATKKTQAIQSAFEMIEEYQACSKKELGEGYI